MVLDNYIIIVALAAIIYAGTARFLQHKLVDRSRMENLQKESKRINEEYKKASERKDKEQMEEIMAKQMEMLKEMNQVMFQQFKPMIIIISIFLILMFVLNSFNPAITDDVTIDLYDDGEGCDQTAGDGIYSTCFDLDNNENYGKWTITAHALNQGKEVAKNESYFLYNVKSHADRHTEPATGDKIEVYTNKEIYYPTEKAIISVKPAEMTNGFEILGVMLSPPQELEVDQIKATISNGTYFYVELPFTIPLLNVKRIFQPQWWFILVSLISGLIMSFIINKWRKKK